VATLQEEARALGDPTRHEIFRYIAAADQSVDIPELTEHFGLNHNAIRQHVAKLVGASLVAEGRAPTTGRGRPRHVYTIDPRAESRWDVHGPYERLSAWLAEMVRTGDTPVEVGRRAGRRQHLGEPPTTAPVDTLVDAMSRHGFDPDADQHGEDLTVILRTCPFESTALADPDTVCQLHLGMALGVAEGLDGLEVNALVPKDPRGAHCRLECSVDPAPDDPAP
jgi:predicted ArsR family transcriptional regulator